MSFSAIPSGEGWEVVDDATGHPVTHPRDSHQSAAATATILNRAALAGPKVLARALGCVDEGEPDYLAVKF
jgi:hypothetical protein